MAKILVSGLINTETTVRIRKFPVEYYPIDYPFFGVNTAVAGVAFNIAKALRTLEDDVVFASITGQDITAEYIRKTLKEEGIPSAHVKTLLQDTPTSVVLYDNEGRRQIYCDLKNIQETDYGFSDDLFAEADIVVACNTNFNRPLLQKAKAAGKTIATDVHVLSDIYDGYNWEFMTCADILFLSDEHVWEDYRGFLWSLAQTYGNEIIVLGRGSKGAAIYTKADGQIRDLPAVRVGDVVNTVGAGDALFSAFIHYYGKGLAPVEALARAQIFASAKIGTSGASRGFVSETEVERLYQLHAPQIFGGTV